MPFSYACLVKVCVLRSPHFTRSDTSKSMSVSVAGAVQVNVIWSFGSAVLPIGSELGVVAEEEVDVEEEEL